ncbi:PREDICTED: uncharacterized protein LOC106552561 [Thamnophis sirtalis]|uniref:Uncharacterized protein LOC106552561 n=1 Tax=Thamnophis sirtalis TaxID=35019 RepID=A0A6I9YQB7_9SAUR|nr:PREDICTED: uncharacterized protein LOC106552561 [Thamnophis sirtalis]
MVVSYFQDEKITLNHQRPSNEHLDVESSLKRLYMGFWGPAKRVSKIQDEESRVLSQFSSSKHQSYFGVSQSPHPTQGLVSILQAPAPGYTAGAGRSDTCRLVLYGVPLLDASEESSLQRAPRSPTRPGKTRAADPPAKETSRLWIRLGASAQEFSRSPTDPPEAGVLLMEGEQCEKWVRGKASPVETFHCPTQDNQWKEMFCCGTCMASYCCSSTKERLDQASCSKIVRTENQEPDGPTVEKIDVLEFIAIALALSTSFIVFFCVLRYRMECLEAQEAQRVANAQLDLIQGVPATSVIDSPPPERAASAAPDPPSSVPEESQSSSELPTAVANVLWGFGNPIREVMKLPIFILGGPLGVVPEEEKEEEEEEEETDF